MIPRIAARVRVLSCGLTVVVHRDNEVPQVAVSVVYRVGSSDERPDRTGFAHLFEHLFKQPPERFGGYHHYDVLKRAGSSEANASTGADRTSYHEVLPAHELALALWIESDRMGYLAVAAERLVQQQAVVRSERRQRYEDVAYGPERFALGLALYPDGHPARHGVIGRHEDIQAATLDDVHAFYRTWYVPANATLVIAGDVDDAECDALVDRYFGDFPGSLRPPRREPVLPPLAETQVEVVVDKFAALTRIHRVWHGPGAFGDDEPALDTLVAGWSATGTGALWQRLSYDTQLAQRVSAWTSGTRLGGEIHVAVDLRTGSDPAAVRAILDEECARGIDDRSIERAYTRREASSIWALTGLSRRAAIVQRYMLYTGQPDGLATDLERYRAVTGASIDAARARWIDQSYVEVTTDPGSAASGSSAPP